MVSEPLPDMSPVLLLDMGVVVRVIGSGAGELNRLDSISKVTPKMVIYEFTSVISVEPKYREGYTSFHVFETGQYSDLALAPACCLLGPSGGYVDEIDSICVVALNFVTTVGDCIGLYESGFKLVPLIGLNWYLLA